MTRHLFVPFLVALIATLGIGAAAGQPAATPKTESQYSHKTPGPDGSGKVYMGREISIVMGHRMLEYFERRDRTRDERPDLVIDGMELAKDSVVADIGAGSGYFTFRISSRIPEGKVMAVDIQPEMLQILEERCELAGITNVQPIMGSITDPGLPRASVDAALLVDAYHEFSHPQEMMENLLAAMKPDGRVYLVEYRGEDPEVTAPALHKMTEAQARLELEAVGFHWVENRTFLPTQHFLVFERPSGEG